MKNQDFDIFEENKNMNETEDEEMLFTGIISNTEVEIMEEAMDVVTEIYMDEYEFLERNRK